MSKTLTHILPDTCSDAEKEKDPITAEEVVEAIKDGKKVEIKNAVITGPFILKSVNVEGEVTIQNTTIRGDIDWSYATFKRVLNLKDSIFETFETDATFIAVTVEKDLILDGATFWGEANFSDVTVMGAFYSQSTKFKKDAIFTDGTFKRRIEFSKSTFVGVANFENARIGGTAKFTGVKFKKKASFNGAQIEESALFYPADLFSIDVEFEDDLNNGIISKKLEDIFKTKDYSLSENAMVTNGQDDKWRITDIEKIYIIKKEEGKLNISNPATFGGEVDFTGARIGSSAEFMEAKFEEKASFNSAKVDGVAFFNSSTFVRDADFISARIGSNAEFMEAKFEEKASFNKCQG